MFLVPSHLRKILHSLLTEEPLSGPHTALLLLVHGQVLCAASNADADWVASEEDIAEGDEQEDDGEAYGEEDEEPYIPTPHRNRMLRGLIKSQLAEGEGFPVVEVAVEAGASAGGSGGEKDSLSSGGKRRKKLGDIKIECDLGRILLHPLPLPLPSLIPTPNPQNPSNPLYLISQPRSHFNPPSQTQNQQTNGSRSGFASQKYSSHGYAYGHALGAGNLSIGGQSLTYTRAAFGGGAAGAGAGFEEGEGHERGRSSSTNNDDGDAASYTISSTRGRASNPPTQTQEAGIFGPQNPHQKLTDSGPGSKADSEAGDTNTTGETESVDMLIQGQRRNGMLVLVLNGVKGLGWERMEKRAVGFEKKFRTQATAE